MLSPDAAYSPWVLAIAFALLLAALAINAIIKDRREFKRFSRYRSSKRRRRTMRKWLIQSLALFGTSSIVLLVLSWQYVPLLLADFNSWGWVTDARGTFDANATLSWSIVIALVVIIFGGAVAAIIAVRNETDIPSIGDIQAMLPRNRKELPYGAALSINAGVVEELLFRLAMPAVIYGFTGNVVIAVVVSIVIFGVLHAYQGIAGIVGTMLIGAVFMALYLVSQNILVPIVVHALFDLRSLVLIPMIIHKVHWDRN